MFRIDYDYRKGGDKVKETRANSVLENMRNNIHFPDPPAAVAQLVQLQQQFSLARVGAENRDRQKSAVKNNVAKDLVQCLDTIAKYVTEKANGDGAIYLSSGFKIVEEGQSGDEFGPILNFKVRNGKNSGEVIMSCTAVDEADSYAFHYAEVTDGVLEWKYVFITGCKTTIVGLEPGKKYVFYMEAIATRMRSVKSEQLTKYVA